MKHLKKLLFCSALVALAAVAAFTQEAKNALLIANGEYGRGMGSLPQPVPEAQELKSALESIGFNVTLVQNADLEAMQKALAAFKAKTQREGGYAFFHYGGHAVQVNGVNYLIPLKANLDDELSVGYRCVYVDEVMNSLRGDANIVILDSCRNNPFAQSTHRGAGTRGLAAVGIKPPNSIIVYSAAAGQEATDGLFTPILTKCITEKNKNFYDVLQEVRTEVYNATGGKQKPGAYDELLSTVYLAGFDASAPVQQAAYMPPVRQENRNDTGDRTYRVNGVSFTLKPVAAVQGAMLGDNSQENNKEHTVNLSAYYIGETEVTQELWEAVMGNNPSYFTGAKNPVEQVSWNDCVEFCNELTAEVMGEEHCVYTIRGSSVTADFSKRGFRLPTEAEWEWAAMGGKTYRWAGTDMENRLKKYAWYDANSGGKTHEVGQKEANGYGLYDMSGNVKEWIWDSFGGDALVNRSTDSQGTSFGSYRFMRGGSWNDSSYYAARVYRTHHSRVLSMSELGFRLVVCP